MIAFQTHIADGYVDGQSGEASLKRLVRTLARQAAAEAFAAPVEEDAAPKKRHEGRLEDELLTGAKAEPNP